MSPNDDVAFYEQMAAELLETAMGCTDTRTRNRLVKWANLFIERLEKTRSAAKSFPAPVSLQ
jgi:hypothetical protein